MIGRFLGGGEGSMYLIGWESDIFTTIPSSLIIIAELAIGIRSLQDVNFS